jgi:hypothetical protein
MRVQGPSGGRRAVPVGEMTWRESDKADGISPVIQSVSWLIPLNHSQS